MEQMKFKTTIKCTGCLEKVAPHLNEKVGSNKWEVDLKNPDKILTVNTESASEEDLIATVKKAGYEIERR
jgi:copper chaperone